jgi:hypothetical protein
MATLAVAHCKGRYHFENLGVNGKTLKRILNRMTESSINFNGLRRRSIGGLL